MWQTKERERVNRGADVSNDHGEHGETDAISAHHAHRRDEAASAARSHQAQSANGRHDASVHQAGSLVESHGHLQAECATASAKCERQRSAACRRQPVSDASLVVHIVASR